MRPEDLVAAAIAARKNAYAPYSHFQVGAALLAEDGEIITGSNVENASYGLTICAERAAVFAASSRGIRRFLAIAIATDPGAAPCGACRQVLREFATDLPIHLAETNGRFRTTSLAALLPESFGPEDLGQA